MIAPRKISELPENSESERRMRHVRRMVAAAFPPVVRPASPPPISAWKSWLLVAWLFSIALAYFAMLMGLLK